MEEKDDSIIFDENSEIKEEIQNSSLIQANILFKLFSATCQIITSRGNGSGFFLKLKYYPLYCLLSNEHIITTKITSSKEEIKILYDNKEKNIIIKLNEKKFINEYSHIGIELTIVEILDSDNISKDYFIPFNYEINDLNKYINKQIWVFQYPSEKEDKGELNISRGKNKAIEPRNLKFNHSSKVDKGSSGSPIFLEKSLKIIGIQNGGINCSNLFFHIFNF